MIDLREQFSMFPLRIYDFVSEDTFLKDELEERKAARETILDILKETFGRENVKEVEGLDISGLLTKVEIKNATVMIPVEFIYDPTQNQITSKFANPSNKLSRILDGDNAKDALAASYFCASELKQLARDIDNGETISSRTFQKFENLMEKGIRDLYRTWEKALYKITKKFSK